MGHQETSLVRLKIDGRTCVAVEGSTILETAKEHDISIPTLCYYEEISPGGRCRLCWVVIQTRNRAAPLVLACAHLVKEGMEVYTHSGKVITARKKAMKVLLAQAPNAAKIRELALDIGLKVPPTRSTESNCISCGLCARACREIAGRSAISLVSKRDRKGQKPCFRLSPERCIGCGTCSFLCPTGSIKVMDFGRVRIMGGNVLSDKRGEGPNGILMLSDTRH